MLVLVYLVFFRMLSLSVIIALLVEDTRGLQHHGVVRCYTLSN